jgi:hypothetical protein
MTSYQPTHWVDLDVVRERDESFDDAGNAVVAKAGQTGAVTFQVAQEHGPAGGNPVYVFTGSEDAVTAVARSHVNDDDEFDALVHEGMIVVAPVGA